MSKTITICFSFFAITILMVLDSRKQGITNKTIKIWSPQSQQLLGILKHHSVKKVKIIFYICPSYFKVQSCLKFLFQCILISLFFINNNNIQLHINFLVFIIIQSLSCCLISLYGLSGQISATWLYHVAFSIESNG